MEGGATATMVTTIQPIISALTGVITVDAVVGVIAAVVGITISFALMWWAARYVSRKINSAFKKGRASA